MSNFHKDYRSFQIQRVHSHLRTLRCHHSVQDRIVPCPLQEDEKNTIAHAKEKTRVWRENALEIIFDLRLCANKWSVNKRTDTENIWWSCPVRLPALLSPPTEIQRKIPPSGDDTDMFPTNSLDLSLYSPVNFVFLVLILQPTEDCQVIFE